MCPVPNIFSHITITMDKNVFSGRPRRTSGHSPPPPLPRPAVGVQVQVVVVIVVVVVVIVIIVVVVIAD